jgi:hypothetical protein
MEANTTSSHAGMALALWAERARIEEPEEMGVVARHIRKMNGVSAAAPTDAATCARLEGRVGLNGGFVTRLRTTIHVYAGYSWYYKLQAKFKAPVEYEQNF